MEPYLADTNVCPDYSAYQVSPESSGEPGLALGNRSHIYYYLWQNLFHKKVLLKHAGISDCLTKLIKS